MRAPRFWKKKNVKSASLLPVAVVGRAYALVRMRLARKKAFSGTTIICVGNITAGGTGKTPTCTSIGKWLESQGLAYAFVSRGYGGKTRGPVKVNPEIHRASEVGDEPLLLANVGTTYVAKNRVAGILRAAEDGAKIVVLDDGFQDRRFEADLNLLVVDGGYGFGNGRLIPAGPLREPVAPALARADAVLMIGEDAQNVAPQLGSLPVLHAYLSPLSPSPATVVAFAGIGRPEKFFATLVNAGYAVAAHVGFADHHPYTLTDLEGLEALSRKLNAPLITTEKDAIRLPPAYRERVLSLGVALQFKQPEALSALLASALNRKNAA